MSWGWGNYGGMLPEESKPGKRGYYPVSNAKEWDELPDLYKVMEWDPVHDPLNHGQLSAVKAVVFDVVYMEPYGIHAKVSVHPQDVHKLLFCNYGRVDCLLYSVCGIELENGSRLGAKWQQDTLSGAFAIYCGGTPVAKQGGFLAYIPEHIQRLEDGTFKYDFQFSTGKTAYYSLLNPFERSFSKAHQSHETGKGAVENMSSLDDKIGSAANRASDIQPGTALRKKIEPER